MAEVKLPRLLGAAKEFNIGQDTLIEFLVGKGFDREELKPTAKLSIEMYEALQHNFQGDKNAKTKADQIAIPKNVQTERKRKEEEEITFRKEEPRHANSETTTAKPTLEKNIPEVKPEIPVPAEQPVAEEKIPEPIIAEIRSIEPDIVKIEAPEIEGLKIIDKIDLSAINSSTRPKKIEKKPEEVPVVEEVQPENIKEEAPAEIIAEVHEEPAVETEGPAIIENIRAEKIEGPKVLGKIELPVENDTRPKPSFAPREEKRKRKRIPIDKKRGRW